MKLFIVYLFLIYVIYQIINNPRTLAINATAIFPKFTSS